MVEMFIMYLWCVDDVVIEVCRWLISRNGVVVLVSCILSILSGLI